MHFILRQNCICLKMSIFQTLHAVDMQFSAPKEKNFLNFLKSLNFVSGKSFKWSIVTEQLQYSIFNIWSYSVWTSIEVHLTNAAIGLEIAHGIQYSKKVWFHCNRAVSGSIMRFKAIVVNPSF